MSFRPFLRRSDEQQEQSRRWRRRRRRRRRVNRGKMARDGGKGKKKNGGPKRWTTHTHTSGERDRGGPSSYCNAEVSILPGCIIVQSATAAARCFRDHAPDHGIEQYITSSSRHPSNFRVLFREFENRVLDLDEEVRRDLFIFYYTKERKGAIWKCNSKSFQVQQCRN